MADPIDYAALWDDLKTWLEDEAADTKKEAIRGPADDYDHQKGEAAGYRRVLARMKRVEHG
jgi:hypothetical protein